MIKEMNVRTLVIRSTVALTSVSTSTVVSKTKAMSVGSKIVITTASIPKIALFGLIKKESGMVVPVLKKKVKLNRCLILLPNHLKVSITLLLQLRTFSAQMVTVLSN